MNKALKLHPLHTPEWVSQVLYETGCYPGSRRTGKTTAALLVAFGEAMQNPDKRIQVGDVDLLGDVPMERFKWTKQYAEDLLHKFGLAHIHLAISPGTSADKYRLTVEFRK